MARKRGKQKQQKKRRQQSGMSQDLRLEIAAVALLGLAALLVLSLYDGAVGALGGLLSRGLRLSFGEAAALVPACVALAGLSLLLRKRLPGWRPRIMGLVLMAWLIAGTLHLGVPPGEIMPSGLVGEYGGLAGAVLALILLLALGELGRLIAMATLGIVAVLLITERPLAENWRSVWTPIAAWFRRVFAATAAFLTPERDRAGREEKPEPRRGPERTAEPAAEGEPAPAGAGDPAGKEEAARHAGPPVVHLPDPRENGRLQEGATEANGAGPAPGAEEQVALPVAGKEGREVPPYRFPSLDLLRQVDRSGQSRDRRDLARQQQVLEQTLRDFGIDATVRSVQQGPAITRYEVRPAPGVKVSRIVNLADDIALSLASADVRIVAPIPGKMAVGIEVPNRQITPVYLREVLDTQAFRSSASPLTVALGEDITGQPVISHLDRLLHLLIAGATGSGKSVLINALLCSLLYKADPNRVKLLLIDPKMVELAKFNEIPHLIAPVITHAKKAAGSLRWIVQQMEERYERFAAAGVRDIGRYNERREAAGEQPEPLMVVVIDELADLMAVAPVDVEDAIQRLAQMARAAGIHLVVATQRPSVDVITGVIKANIPSRIAFAVSSQVDSRTILDTSGAEKLVGKGDMLFMPVGSNKPVRVQGAFVSEEELDRLLRFIMQQAAPEYREDVVAAVEQSGGAAGDFEDELLPDAVQVVVESGQASVSMLQRKLRVGYTRAGRLMDMMEEEGFVGPHAGPKPRDVLISPEQYHQLFGAGAETAAADAPPADEVQADDD